MATDPDQDSFGATVKATLSKIVGESGARAVLFYLGEPAPETFESKLRLILGDGATRLIVQDMRAQEDAKHPQHKRRWFGGRAASSLPAFRALGRPFFSIPLPLPCPG